MGGSSQSWKLEIDAEWAKTEGALHDVVIWIAIEARDRVKRKTPVDTGHAQNNWLVNIGTPDNGETMSIAPPKGAKEADSFSARNAESISNYPKDGTFPAIYLQNNLPYALALEYGHSDQAPLGMVEITIIELDALFHGIEINSAQEWVNL